MVIGASSGIGAACAKQLASQGYQVALLARREEALENQRQEIISVFDQDPQSIKIYPVDVSETSKAQATFETVVNDLEGLDLVIFAAGVMPQVRADEYDIEKDRSMIEVNLLGAIAWLNESAKFLSQLKRGHIVGISSVAGDRGRRGNPVYCTSKAALNTYLESLRNRLDPFGVHVMTVKPGFVDTPMTRDFDKGLLWASARDVGEGIHKAMKKGKATVYLPFFWRYIMLIIKLIPEWLFKRLSL